MKTSEIRQNFLDYFKSQQHTAVPSSSLIPGNDPTLLFTNAGMVQFKDVFLGIEKTAYSRATSSQRCLRAGGKHNDLENVGYTARHHTFFEMLGNFSFGDYFKREAIQFAWSFLTEVLGLPEEKLWVTVYKDDDESADIWLNELGVSAERFSRCGEKDNFWSMGDTGPCGPCSEIFYDHGADVPGGPPGSPDEDGDRYIEIWNLVFMQFNRNAAGEVKPLPNPCVDTGMGLERIAAVMQGVHNNYDIDLFKSLLKALSELIDFKDTSNKSMRVIVDHIRSSAFLIMDGVVPSNEGRGYVLRRIIRRALRHGHNLGQSETFFSEMVAPLVAEMGDAYPELVVAQPVIEKVLLHEEEQFARTLAHGMKLLNQAVEDLDDATLPGQVVFQLYDTYGFPPDLTADIARERGLQIDQAGFDAAMKKQREQSKEASQFSVDMTSELHIHGETQFVGYDQDRAGGTVTTLLVDNLPVTELKEGEAGVVVLDQTPFYAESGGQVGDKGLIHGPDGVFEVCATQKHGPIFLHIGNQLEGITKVGCEVFAEVSDLRQATKLNHSATHLLHAALKKVLGAHVMQKGSLVDPMRLRFDFSHMSAVTPEQLAEVERLVNAEVRANHSAVIEEMPIEEAKARGAEALFGEKYGAEVRVISFGDFSIELCGGTHVEQTGDIGLFKIVSESSVAAGIRRIEAVTGQAALDWVANNQAEFGQVLAELGTDRQNVKACIAGMQKTLKSLEQRLNKVQQSLLQGELKGLLEQAQDIDGVQVLAIDLAGADRDALRQALDYVKSQWDSYAVVFASVNSYKIQLLAGVSKSNLSHFNATELLNQVAGQVGGKGGGRPGMAQGGGDNPAALPAALESVVDWVQNKIK